MMKKVIPVFFTADEAYAPYLAVAVHSLIQNASEEYDYRIIVLEEDMRPDTRRRIAKLGNEHADISFRRMQTELSAITDCMSNRLRCDYFTLTIYFRLFIPAMFPEYDKGIYIDSDIVVPGDISRMYEIDLGENLLGASRDHSIQDIPQLCKYMDYGVGVGCAHYINSGVLLMNMRRLREVGIEREFLRLLKTYHFDTIAPDQDYLNAMCHGSIHYLDECWDAMPIPGKPELKSPCLIHYNLFFKPWCYDDIPYEAYFWKYAESSGFLEEIRAAKAAYSDEQKESDEDCLALLCKRAEMIAGDEENFYTVYRDGLERRLA